MAKKEMQQAVENFMRHHENGETIKETAARYRVSYAGLLYHLDEIAEANGVKRVSLLECPEKSHKGHLGRGPVNYNPHTISTSHPQPTNVDPPVNNGFFDILYENVQNLIKETESLLNTLNKEAY